MNKTKLEDNYTKEIAILKDIFGNSIEAAGGKGHRFFHQLRVAYAADALARKLNISSAERKLIRLAALFHDIGKAPRIKDDGSLDGSQEADKKQGNHMDKTLVFDLLIKYIGHLHNKNVLESVSEIISDSKSYQEDARIVMDADNLDEVGLVNIWKMFTFGGAFKVDIAETLEYYFEEDRPRLLKKMQEILFFDISKEWAQERISHVDKTLKNLQKEVIAEDLK